MIKISKKEKDILRNRLYERDGRECYYCGIKEEDFIPKRKRTGDGSSLLFTIFETLYL